MKREKAKNNEKHEVKQSKFSHQKARNQIKNKITI